jgi:hypothetical protein
MPIFNSINDGVEDQIYSSDFSDYFDNCLSYIDSDGSISVKTLSPCTMVPPTTAVPGRATVTVTANTNHLGNLFKTDWTSTSNNGGVFGLAKDGHVIYGPYNTYGELWSCEDVDACNGFFLSDNSYGYASTTFFPYTVGCWGPASASLTTGLSCSINACYSATTTANPASASGLYSNMFIVGSILIGLNFL